MPVPLTPEAIKPDFSDSPLVAITGVQYNNPEDPRFDLSLENATNMRDAGVPLVVIDSSNEQNHGRVADAHRALGAVVEPARIGGIATQRQQGVAFAVEHGAAKVLSAEPEKVGLAAHAGAISGALDNYDVLVIGRTQSAENTLPPVQQRTERMSGWLLERVLGMPADAMSGGRGFTAAGAEVLADYRATKVDPDTQQEVSDPTVNNWLYLYKVPMEAERRGLRVGGIALDFEHPAEMVEEETDNPAFDAKRYDQFELQVGYLFRERLAGMADDDPDRELVEYVLKMNSLLKATSNGFRDMVVGHMESYLADYYGYKPAARLVDSGLSQPGLKAGTKARRAALVQS